MFLQLLILVLLLGCSAFVSGSETALFNLSAAQRSSFSESTHRLRRAAGRLIQHPDHLILTLMFLNMTVNVAFFAISSLLVLRSAGELPGWQSTLLGLAPLLTIVMFGEVLPKVIALSAPGAFATVVALPLEAVHVTLRPVLRYLQVLLIGPMIRLLAPADTTGEKPISQDELQALLDASVREGTLDDHTTSLLREVVELRDIRVREVMVPRTDIRAFDALAPRSELMELIRRYRFGAVPVFERDLDHIIGLARSSEVLLNPEKPVRAMLRHVVYVPEIISLDRLLETFREKGERIAVAVDEYGGTAGLITIEDVVEEIVGEIHDPEETQVPGPRRIGPDTWLLPGNLPIRTWAEAFRLRIAPGRLETLAGLMASALRRIPVEGDTLTMSNLTLTVRQTRKRRVTQIELKRRDLDAREGA